MAVLTIGEPLICIAPAAPQRLIDADCLKLSFAGAEANVAIGLARLGIATRYVSRIGDDEFGAYIASRLADEGVDVCLRADPAAPTGLYLREITASGRRVFYYRAGSAASRMGPGEFDLALLDGMQYIHLSGITGALSASCAQLLPWIAQAARARGIRVSYDVNHRSALRSGEAARAAAEALAPDVDLVFCSEDDAVAVWGDAETYLRVMAATDREAVLTRGADGATAIVHGERLERAAWPVATVDAIGAGDAFVAGWLYAAVENRPAVERLATACAVAAMSTSAIGDQQGLPRRAALCAFMETPA